MQFTMLYFLCPHLHTYLNSRGVKFVILYTRVVIKALALKRNTRYLNVLFLKREIYLFIIAKSDIQIAEERERKIFSLLIYSSSGCKLY